MCRAKHEHKYLDTIYQDNLNLRLIGKTLKKVCPFDLYLAILLTGKGFEIWSKGNNVLRCSDNIFWSYVVFVQTFVERLAGFMNAITEIAAGFGFVTVFKLRLTIF